MPQEIRDDFATSGFVGPFPLFNKKECRTILRRLEHSPPASDWFKGKATTSRVAYEIATHPGILDRVAEILGDDIMLWGTSVVRRRAGFIHPWHSDIESSNESGRTVSVWIGLANTNANSSLVVASRSHRLPESVQERAAKAGMRRDDIRTSDILAWAHEAEPQSQIVHLAARDGEVILFHGRLWHGSHNTNRLKKRTALLLQYATPETPIRIPVFKEFEWPFHFLDYPLPPCIMVRGTGHLAANRIVSPPHPESGASPTLTTRVQKIDLPLGEDQQSGWKPYPLFRGRTDALADMSCHVSVLSPGVTPHEPHEHPEEELLIVLDGEAELVLVDGEEQKSVQSIRPGSFVYYSAGQTHTIRNAGANPITYLMFKWRGEETHASDGCLESRVVSYGEELERLAEEEQSGFTARRVFEQRTQYLHKLHAHVSTLAPGAGYDPHVDAYDVAILVLSGTIETLGRRVEPHGVVFYSAGESHGMKNPASVPASYLVFEFHGTALARASTTVSDRVLAIIQPMKRYAARLLPPSLKRTLKPILSPR